MQTSILKLFSDVLKMKLDGSRSAICYFNKWNSFCNVSFGMELVEGKCVIEKLLKLQWLYKSTDSVIEDILYPRCKHYKTRSKLWHMTWRNSNIFKEFTSMMLNKILFNSPTNIGVIKSQVAIIYKIEVFLKTLTYLM